MMDITTAGIAVAVTMITGVMKAEDATNGD
jgi:hypothetical protein